MTSSASSLADKAHEIRAELLSAIAAAQQAKSDLDVRVDTYRVSIPEYAALRAAQNRVASLHALFLNASAELRAAQNIG